MSKSVTGLTPDILAEGLIAAARLYGCDPAQVFERRVAGAHRARACVAAALIGLWRQPGARSSITVSVARVLDLHPTTIAPSGLSRLKIVIDDQLTVADALLAAGLVSKSLDLIGAVPKRSPTPAPASAPSPVAKPVPGRANRTDVPKLRRDTKPAAERPLDTPYSSSLAPPLTLNGDDELVAACRRQGGFPIAAVIGGRAVWIAGQNWSHRA